MAGSFHASLCVSLTCSARFAIRERKGGVLMNTLFVYFTYL